MVAQAPNFHFGTLTKGGGGPPSSRPYSQGIDFRATPSYVTDPSGYDVETGVAENYPRKTPQGNVVGWITAPTGTRNRSAQVDPRLAGCGFVLNNTGETASYRLDVAPGDYLLRLALGDATTVQRQNVELWDGGTALGAVATDRATQRGTFIDATGHVWTAAEWPASNVARAVSIRSGILRVSLGLAASGLASSTIASLLLWQA